MYARLVSFALVASVVFLFSACGGQDQATLQIDYEQYQLSNGLNVILHEDKSDPIAAVAILAALSAYPLEDKINLGLDLRGGSHLVLQVETGDALRSETDKDMARLLEEAAGKGLAAATGSQLDETSFELNGKTLGLVGVGRIGRRVAHAAGALGMEVKAYDPYVADAPDGVKQVDSLEDALDADVVSLHLPLIAETAGIIGDIAFAAMRPEAIFVNTARGGLVDHGALLRVLDERPGFVAALDVTDPEPLPDDHPLRHRDDVIGGRLRQLIDEIDDARELVDRLGELVIGEFKPRQHRDLLNLIIIE